MLLASISDCCPDCRLPVRSSGLDVPADKTPPIEGSAQLRLLPLGDAIRDIRAAFDRVTTAP
jgi:hypothetical protein